VALYSALNVFAFFETGPFDFGVGASVASTDNEKGFDDMAQLSLSWGWDFEDNFGSFADFECGADDDGQSYFTASLIGFNLRGTWTRKPIVPTRPKDEPKIPKDGAPT